ncbi:hypothetical protein ACROYT_G022363 [Oculina patagonica]
MDWVDGRPLQNLTMQMLWKILFLIFLEIGHKAGAGGLRLLLPRYVPMKPEDPEEEEPDDDKFVGRGWCGCALCHKTNLEQKRHLPENPRLRATPSSSTPRVSGPSLPWIDVNDELGMARRPLRNTTLLTDLDQEALERTNPRRGLVVCLWSPPWLTPLQGPARGLVMPEHPLRLDATPPIPLLLKQNAVLLGTSQGKAKTVMCLVEQVTCSSVFL